MTVTIDQIKPIFVRVAEANGYPKDLSDEVPTNAAGTQVSPTTSQKGYIAYNSDFLVLFGDKSPNDMNCIVKINDDGIIIIAKEDCREAATILAHAIDTEFPELMIQLKIENAGCSDGNCQTAQA
ncbi:MAG: hypothetical protein HYZ79_07660 [Candidatus Melainabacteria bacterium]|nr:hypothetical protein [Candidatus Melainabacteria bacterium]